MKGLKIINESELLEMLGTNRDDSSLAVEMESTMEVETTQPKVTSTLHFISYINILSIYYQFCPLH